MSVPVPLGELAQQIERFGPNDTVALLWPAPEPGQHALIVDGRGAVHDGSDHAILIQPGRAVLHVTSSGPPA
jgi:hypothetical protein